MNQTPNYNLNKPEKQDPADITQLDINWDTIDTEIKSANDKIATHEARQDNPHNVTKEQLGIDLSDYDAHLRDRNNPHQVTAAQIGLNLDKYDEHIEALYNPHKVTAEQVGALSKNGGTVDGDMNVNGTFTVNPPPEGTISAYPNGYCWIKTPFTIKGYGFKSINDVVETEIHGLNNPTEDGHHFLDISHSSVKNLARLRINVESEGELLSPKELLQVTTHDKVNNEQHWYKIFHEGNKPSGSYVGDGSSSRKSIDTGGVGNVLMFWSPATGSKGFLNPEGGFVVSNNDAGGYPVHFSNDTTKLAYYKNGIIYLGTDEDKINRSGATFYYQCL